MSTPLGDASPGLDTTVGGSTLDGSSTAVGSETAAYGAESAAEATSEGSGRDNPAWNDLLNVIPTQFHSVIKPRLKEWDRNYGALAEKYSRYKQYENISDTDMQNSVNLYNMLNTDPNEVLRRLQQYLGVSKQEAQEIVAEATEENKTPSDNNAPAIDPQIAQMQQQMQLMQAQYAHTQQQQLEDHYSRQIDSDLKALIQQHGQIDVGDILNRYRMQNDRGEEPSIQRAFEEQQAFINSYMAAHGITPTTKPAPPQVLAPSGGMPSNTEQISLKTATDRVAAVKFMLGTANQ